MTLHHLVLRAGERPPRGTVLFLHGLLGNANNLRGFARGFVEAHPTLAAVCVDLREHGRSRGLAGSATLAQCVADLEALPLPAPAVGVVGHSFGGKVAMAYAARGGLERLVVLDATPSRRQTAGTEALRVLELLRDLDARHPQGFTDRAAFEAAVQAFGEAPSIAAWLAMNLERTDDGRRRFPLDLDACEQLLHDYGATDTWDALAPGRVGKTVFVLGGRSPVVDEADRDRLRARALDAIDFTIITVERAGHWVHVDAPEAVREVLEHLY